MSIENGSLSIIPITPHIYQSGKNIDILIKEKLERMVNFEFGISMFVTLNENIKNHKIYVSDELFRKAFISYDEFIHMVTCKNYFKCIDKDIIYEHPTNFACIGKIENGVLLEDDGYIENTIKVWTDSSLHDKAMLVLWMKNKKDSYYPLLMKNINFKKMQNNSFKISFEIYPNEYETSVDVIYT
jgi:hypothetical protein